MKEEELLRLFDEYADLVYRLAYSYFGQRQDAEDTVQAVFLKLIDGTARPACGKERAFLTRITVNHCKDQLRSAWRRRVGPLEEDVPFAGEEDRALLASVMALPEKYRLVIHLHYYEGYSFLEIAQFLKLGVSAVSMRVHRGRALLKKRLGEDYEEAVL